MHGQNLLKQRSAASWHAHDEDLTPVGLGGMGPLLLLLLGKHPLNALEHSLVPDDIEALLRDLVPGSGRLPCALVVAISVANLGGFEPGIPALFMIERLARCGIHERGFSLRIPPLGA
jgi:hypothetical protein